MGRVQARGEMTDGRSATPLSSRPAPRPADPCPPPGARMGRRARRAGGAAGGGAGGAGPTARCADENAHPAPPAKAALDVADARPPLAAAAPQAARAATPPPARALERAPPPLAPTPLVDAAADLDTRLAAALALDVGGGVAPRDAARLQRTLALVAARRATDAQAAAAAKRAADAATARAALLEAALGDRPGAARWLILIGAAPPTRAAVKRAVSGAGKSAATALAAPAGGLLALAPRAAARLGARAAARLAPGASRPRTKPKAPCHFDAAAWLEYL